MKRAVRTWMASAFLMLFAGAVLAQADKWPSKPIRIVVTFSPGGSSDIVARVISVPLSKSLGQPVIVDNKPGGGGTIGASEVARAAPDGYTLLMSNTTPISLSPFMLTPMPYDSVKSFTHVGLVAVVPDVIMVHPSVPAKNMAELVAWIKAQKKPINYGSGGIGSIGHILGETFKRDQKLDIEHVGYKGSSPMIADLLNGTLSFSFDTLPQNVPHMKAGKLRPIAVTSRTRSGIAPDIPTVLEANMPALVAENFIGISAPGRFVRRDHETPACGDPGSARRSGGDGAVERSRHDATQDVDGRVRNVRRRADPRVGAGGEGVRGEAELSVDGHPEHREGSAFRHAGSRDRHATMLSPSRSIS